MASRIWSWSHGTSSALLCIFIVVTFCILTCLLYSLWHKPLTPIQIDYISRESVPKERKSSKTYYIGEEIQARVSLHDGHDKRKYSGGDQLRATIENKQLQASAPCVITDNKDGTHTVMCVALWSGASTIKILGTRDIYGMFKSRDYKEKVVCHPNYTHLLKLTNYTELCNMTYVNSGMPFYCGKPKDVHLLCQDWEQVSTPQPYPVLPITECEETLLKRGQRTLKQTLLVNINGRSGNRNISVIAQPSIPCSEYNVSLLWHSRNLTGFFYKGVWIIRNCRGVRENSHMPCLKDRQLYLFGDSTLRDWYMAIIKRFQCQPITESWQSEKWHKDAECYNNHTNFRSGWYPHSQPFNVGIKWDDARYTLYSVSRRIDNIPRNTRAIVVVHLYMHFLAFHHNVFKQRMEIIRQSIENFLTQSSHSIVIIKAPHTFEDTPIGSVRLSDYYGYVYSKILYDVFNGLHDRVILLNNRDATLAQHEIQNHPAENIINAMIDQMLNYACKDDFH